MALPSGPLAQNIGTLVCRIIVPLWVLTGAIFKMIEHTPRLLPRSILDTLIINPGLENHAHAVLSTLIALELFAVAVMFFLPRLARPMAIFMLSCFVAILAVEIFNGRTDCGCLGGTSPPIWVMVAIDASLLALAILFRPHAPKPGTGRSIWPTVAAAAFTVAGAATTLAVVLPAGKAPPPPTPDGVDPGTETGGGNSTANGKKPPAYVPPSGYQAGTTRNPRPRPQPGVWFVSDINAWIGLRWNELPLLQFMPQWPSGMDEGVRYITFYGRTCDHCEDMFYQDLAPDQTLASNVTAVEIATEKDRFPAEDEMWDMPESMVEHIRMPLGTDWVITTPLTIKLVDGVVECAQEGDHKKCMDLE